MYKPLPLDYDIRGELVGYSEDVLAGKIPACEAHKWACLRFLNDLKREGTSEFPYLFVPKKAIRFLNWMKLFRHTKGVLRGQRIDPHIIQRFIFGNIYGWSHMETGLRRFRKGYWQVARKNTKSQSNACVGSYEAAAMGAGMAEVYCAATKTDQARIVWDEIDVMIRNCPELRDKFKTAYGRIIHEKTGSFIRTLSKEDRRTGDGLNPQCGIIDEYHAHETSEFYDILVSGMGAREEPLLMVITTAGFELNNPCYRVEYQYVRQILDPNSPIENDQYFVMINELDKDPETGNLLDDIRDPLVWEKANPILASYKEGRDYLAAELQAALDVPDKLVNFLTKNMNVWVNQRENGYMRMDKWAACPKEEVDVTSVPCYVGVDLSSKLDLTSVSFVFPLNDGRFYVVSHSFIPEERLVEKRHEDKVPYDLWVKQGLMTATPGAVVDYEFVKEHIKRTIADHGWEVAEVCVDPWNAQTFNQEMMNEGFTVVEVPQSMKFITTAVQDFREKVYQGRVIHNNNPVLAWAVGNAIAKVNASGSVMLDKSKSRDRIDPLAATITAWARAMHVEPTISIEEFADDEFLARLWG